MGKKTIIVILVILFAAAISIWFGYGAVKWSQRSARETSFYSAMSWLDAALDEALADYYKAHNRYPEKLTELTIDFPGDNARPEMLNEFKYTSDGKSYEMTWVTKYGDEVHTHKRKGIEGKKSGLEGPW